MPSVYLYTRGKREWSKLRVSVYRYGAKKLHATFPTLIPTDTFTRLTRKGEPREGVALSGTDLKAQAEIKTALRATQMTVAALLASGKPITSPDLQEAVTRQLQAEEGRGE